MDRTRKDLNEIKKALRAHRGAKPPKLKRPSKAEREEAVAASNARIVILFAQLQDEPNDAAQPAAAPSATAPVVASAASAPAAAATATVAAVATTTATTAAAAAAVATAAAAGAPDGDSEIPARSRSCTGYERSRSGTEIRIPGKNCCFGLTNFGSGKCTYCNRIVHLN